MLRGRTERKTLELNGWGIGDILEGKGRCRHDGEPVVGFGKDYVSEFAGEEAECL